MLRAAKICSLLISLVCVSCSEVPEIKEREVVFPDGKILKYEPQRRVHANAEEALRRREPVSISEKVVLIRNWQRVAVIRTATLYEGETREVSLYDYTGALLAPPKKIVGDVFFLEEAHRILLGQRSAHYLVAESYLLDASGHVVRVIPQPENVVSFGYSPDEQILWIVSNAIRDGRPIGQLNVYDSDGNAIGQFSFFEDKVIEVDYKGRHYRIAVATPQIPG